MREQDLDEVMAIEAAIYSHPWTRGNFADSLRAGYQCRTWRLAQGRGGGFAAYPDLLKGKLLAVRPEVHPTAIAVAQLAAPRLTAGEGVDAALALPAYLRDKVALTTRERAAG